MNSFFKKLWDAARPYYEKGRPLDLQHIEWMIPEARTVCDKENLDKYLFIPLVILHDIGYSQISTKNPFHKNVRKAHMKEGAVLSMRLLSEEKFRSDKLEKVVKLIAIHDVWAFNEHEAYNRDKVLGIFNDLDFIWMVTEIGFSHVAEYLKLSHIEMLSFIQSTEKLSNRPFSTKTTEELYCFYLNERLQCVF